GRTIPAYTRRTPEGHLEAGRRAGDITSPCPEEENRRLTGQIASLHLAPTSTSRGNLLREAISERDIVVTGNTVIDTLFHAVENLEVQFDDSRLERLRRERAQRSTRRVLLVTAHRRENHGEAMVSIGRAVTDLAEKYPELLIVFPLHKNPRVRDVVVPLLESRENVVLLEPLPYPQFPKLVGLADLVLTDSGGVQEEAPSLGKPVLVMRENTERPEAVLAGTVKLIGTHRQRLVDEVSLLLDSQEAYNGMANAVNPYGDGKAAERAVAALRWKFLGGERPEDFTG